MVCLFEVANGAHDARAARLGSEHDPLRHDVRWGVTVAREHRNRERLGRLQAGVAGALLKPLDASPKHVDPAVSVHGEVLHPEGTENASSLADRRRDVVQFEIEKDLVPEIGDRTDRLRTGSGVELKADLGHPEVVLQRSTESDRSDEIIHVKRKRQPIPDGRVDPRFRCVVSHVLLRSTPPRTRRRVVDTTVRTR